MTLVFSLIIFLGLLCIIFDSEAEDRQERERDRERGIRPAGWSLNAGCCSKYSASTRRFTKAPKSHKLTTETAASQRGKITDFEV